MESQPPAPALPPDLQARYPLVGWLPDRDRGVTAIETLRTGGFADEDAVLWLGSDGDPGERQMPGRDRQIFLVVARDSLVGTYLGALVGAVLGVALLLVPGVRDAVGGVSWRTLLIAAALGAIAGVFGGSLLGMVAALDRQRAGSDTYADQLPEGATWLLLRPRDDEQEREALALIARLGGRPVPSSR
jgi:hypothetical protein